MRKGQTAIIGVLFAFMLIAVAAIMQEPLLQFVGIAVNSTANTTVHGTEMITIMNGIPLFLWIVILIGAVALITGKAQ